MRTPALMWTGQHGQLATALGVSKHRADVVERHLNVVFARDGTLKEMFDALEAIDPPLNHNEWTSATFALGYFNGVVEAEVVT